MTDELISRQMTLEALGERPMVWTDSDYELGQQNQYDADRRAIESVRPVQATLTGDEYTQIRGIILEAMEQLERAHLLPGIVLSLEVAQHILEKEDKNP